MRNVLCFGDSNTWGYNPRTGERFPWGVRWTSILQEKFEDQDIRILEEGLCGRTTIFEDRSRPGRKGIDSLSRIIREHESIDAVVLMLGTNDCKSYYHNSIYGIAEGIEKCLDVILKSVPAQMVLLVSPIWLGEDVWMDRYDPEFNKESVLLSRQLKDEYYKVAERKNVYFIAASDYVSASVADQEHLNANGHHVLAEIIYEKLRFMESELEEMTA